MNWAVVDDFILWRHTMWLCLVTQSCPTLCNPMDCSPPVSSVHVDSPGKNTGAGCHFQLQGIFSTQGLNLCLFHLLYWQADSLPLCHLGSPWIDMNKVQIHCLKYFTSGGWNTVSGPPDRLLALHNPAFFPPQCSHLGVLWILEPSGRFFPSYGL